MKIIKNIFSTEFCFIMFVFSGAFKESVNIPIDLSVLFLGLTLIGTCVRFIKKPFIKKWHLMILAIFISLLMIMLISIMFGTYTEDSMDKIVKFTLLTLPTVILPMLFIQGKKSIEKLFIAISIIGTILSIASLPMILNPSSMFVGFNDGNYMGLARLTGASFIILSYFIIVSKKRFKILILPFWILNIVVLMSTGSRMPIVALVIAGLFLLTKVFIIKDSKLYIRKKAMYLFVTLIIGIIAFVRMLTLGMFDTVIYRFGTLFQSGGGVSVSTRIERYKASIEMFSDHIISGVGIGNFGLFHDTKGFGSYSHNLFFELISELGIFGMIWFFIFISLFVYVMFKLSVKYPLGLRITTIIITLYFFLNAMVSGDINDNRALYFFVIVLAYMSYERKELNLNKKEIAI